MSLPYFAMYPTDFDAKTAHLTLAEDGAYNRLLRLQWASPGCKLPADLPWIMRKMRAVSEADQATVQGIIAEFFTRKGGKIFSDRLLKEWVKSSAANERRILAGAKGVIAKALKAKENAPSNAKAMLWQPEPEPERKKDTEANASGEVAPPDIAKIVFDAGVDLIAATGTPARQARSFIGKLRQTHPDTAIFDALTACGKAGAVDPIPWITASLGAASKAKTQQQINDEMMRQAFAQIQGETRQ